MEISVYEKFKALSEKKRMSAIDKMEIEEVAQAYGLTINKNCPNCYRDTALQIALANKPASEPAEEGEWELYPDVDITIESYRFGHLHICQKNCNPANVKLWLEAGVPLRYFKKYPHNDDNK